MFRWKYITQRLALVGLAIALSWLLLNPVLRTVLVQAGQQLVGAKVDLERLQSLLHRSELQLNGIAVADPRAPMQNLFEAETATLDVDAGALLRRRVVIKSGHIGNIQLGTPRDASGALTDTTETQTSPDWTDGITSAGEQWVEQAVGALGKKVEHDLESVALGKELLDRWPAAYEGLESDTKSMGQRGRELVEQIRQTKEKPIQSMEHYRGLLQDVEQLRQDALVLRQQLGQLNEQMQRDRVAWDRAKQHDVEYVQQHLQLTSLDPEALSDYFLGPELGGRVQQLVTWVQWGRRQFASEDDAPLARGVDVLLPGIQARPSFLLQQLGLDGNGSSGGQPFQFTGTLRDWSNQPKLHADPATIEVSTQGAIQLQAHATLDRSGAAARDHIEINWPQLPQPARTLGNDSLRLAVAPGVSTLALVLDLDGESLSGHLDFHQPNVKLRSEADAGGVDLTQPLNQAVAAVSDLKASIRLGGTLKQPTWKLRSNLGSQVATGIQTAFTAELKRKQTALIGRANEQVETQLTSLQQELQTKQQDLLAELGADEELTRVLTNELSGLLGGKWSQDLLGNQGLFRGLLQR